MSKGNLLTLASFLLIIMGIYMIWLGTSARILPPTVTGVGFIIIGAVFWRLR